MKPDLKILPPAQLELWPLLSKIPSNFILYGGTAIALQLGHRISVDYDFFSSQTLNLNELLKSLPFLSNTNWVHPEINTLNCQVELPKGVVKLQFLAGLNERQGRIEDPLQCEDNGIFIASLPDLLASKLNTIQLRAEIKDYLDIHALLDHGLELDYGLGCAKAIFGSHFDPGTSIRALCSFRDGDLPQLPLSVKNDLIKAALKINEIPIIQAKSKTIT